MCLTQRLVSNGVCAGNAAMPTSTCSSVPLTVSHCSMSGGGDEAGPAVGAKRAHLETSVEEESHLGDCSTSDALALFGWLLDNERELHERARAALWQRSRGRAGQGHTLAAAHTRREQAVDGRTPLTLYLQLSWRRQG